MLDVYLTIPLLKILPYRPSFKIYLKLQRSLIYRMVSIQHLRFPMTHSAKLLKKDKGTVQFKRRDDW